MFNRELPILPKSIRSVLAHVLSKLFGIALIAGAGASAYFLVNPPLMQNTWTTLSSGSDANLLAKTVDLFVHFIGMPSVIFILIVIFGFGVRLVLGARRRHYKVTAMRTFIAAMSLSAAVALLIPDMFLGGVFGTFVTNDLGDIFPMSGMVFGAAFMAMFVILATQATGFTINKFLMFFYKIGRAFERAIALFSRKSTKREIPKYEVRPAKRSDKFGQLIASMSSKKTARKRVSNIISRVPDDEDEYYEVEYRLPPPELLEKSVFDNVVTREHRAIAESMEINFAKYGVTGSVRAIHPGPVITRYDFEPDDGQKTKKIVETSVDMQRALAAERLRIALVSRTQYIGIEMPNPNRQTICYRGLMESPEFTDTKMKIPLALGVDISGKPLYQDLTTMVHMLIAGRTGSGKSVFIQSIITSIVYHAAPDEVKLVIVDPKGVDFNKWKNIPHLIAPIVANDVNAAINVLKWSVREMDERYKKLQEIEAQNIADYNILVDKWNQRGKKLRKKVPVGTNEDGSIDYEVQEVTLEKMPYVVIIVDEFADLMSQAKKEVEASISRLVAKARASGIHLVMATQRPDTSVITGTIKSNLPARVSFQARSNIDSMVSLGQVGAETLLAKGDMMYSESGREPVRIHGALVTDKEVEKVAKYLRSQGISPEYIDDVTANVDDEFSSGSPGSPSTGGVCGDLYQQAVEIVVRDNKPTISYIQRRLGIGYNKAATLIEQMEANGVIAKGPGGKYEVI